MADWDSLERLRARQAEFEAFDERIKELQGDLGNSWLAVFVAGAAAVLIVVLLVWLWSATRGSKAAQEHPMLAKIAYKKLAPGSMTRQRLQRAGELFAEGWQALQSADRTEAMRCLELFAKAVELDELACGWNKEYEASLEKVGDFFADPEPEAGQPPPPKPTKDEVYNSMLTEAYLVLVLYTVVALLGKPSQEVAEDYEVVKTRLDHCIKLQPRNPALYKLRADWCQRFPNHADRDTCTRDFQKAVALLELDKEGTSFRSHGVDAGALRRHLLCYCHFQLGSHMQHKKEYDDALKHYELALEFSEPDFIHLPETHFNLCILTIIRMQPDDNRSALVASAIRHYSDGSAAAKKLVKWMPSKTFQASQKMAKQALSQLSKAGFSPKNLAASEKKST